MSEKLYWEYNFKEQKAELVSGKEFLERLLPLIQEPIEAMEMFDGDLMMSDFQKLRQAYNKIRSALEE
jgi:hypothetical protein